MSNLLTPAERVALDRLADAWNDYMALPELVSPDRDQSERQTFLDTIHAAQRIILSRPMIRAIEAERNEQ